MTIDVFCDEAGRSGGNLFDDQPWFALAAHDYTDAEARAVLPALRQAREWKWSALRLNFRLATEVLTNPALIRSRIALFIAEKPYVAWLKLYEDLYGDALNTPVLARRVHADRLWAVLGDHPGMPDVLTAYMHAVRTERHDSLLTLRSALLRLARPPTNSSASSNRAKRRRLSKAYARMGAVIDAMIAHTPLLATGTGASRAERGANLDPHIAGLAVVFDKWAPAGTPYWLHQQRGPGWVRVHHDRIDSMPAGYIDLFRRLPAIESFDFLESDASPAIQLADVLAGSALTAANPRAPTRIEAIPLWRWLRENAIDARFIWEVIARPEHEARYPLVRS